MSRAAGAAGATAAWRAGGCGVLPPIICFTCAVFCKWLICLEFSPHSHFPRAGRSMPAGVAHADSRPVACLGLHGARQADAIEILNTEYPSWQSTHPGPRLPADQSEHVGAGDDGSNPVAAALATAMGIEKHANAHPACATSYLFDSKSALLQARSHPRALATPAELKLGGTWHTRQFPSFQGVSPGIVGSYRACCLFGITGRSPAATVLRRCRPRTRKGNAS